MGLSRRYVTFFILVLAAANVYSVAILINATSLGIVGRLIASLRRTRVRRLRRLLLLLALQRWIRVSVRGGCPPYFVSGFTSKPGFCFYHVPWGGIPYPAGACGAYPRP